MAGPAQYKATDIALRKGTIRVYANPKVDHALKAVLVDLTLYKVVRLIAVRE